MSLYWLNKAVERFDEVWEILKMVDVSKRIEELIEEKVRIRRRGRGKAIGTSYFCRECGAFTNFVYNFEDEERLRLQLCRACYRKYLERRLAKGLCLLWAMGIVKILETIREGETHYYLNLKFTKKDGKVRVEKISEKERKELYGVGE